MSLAATVLIIGASVSASWGGIDSPGHILAKRLGAQIMVSAHSGAKLHQVMPADSVVRDAAVVVAIDALYWYGRTKPEADEAIAAADKLMRLRDGKPLVLGTIPWPMGESVRVNKWLADNCTNACILVRLEDKLQPPSLHPNAVYMREVAGSLWKAQEAGK